MSDPFLDSFNALILVEGGESNHKSDRGGHTMYGVTESVARANGYDGAMSDLTIQMARAIAKKHYWDILRLDDVAKISLPIAEELFDTGYNMGVGIAGRFFQRLLESLNRQGRDYPDITVDGLVGPMTLYSFKAYMLRRGRDGERVMMAGLNALQGARYVDITDWREEQEDFLFGWLLQRVAG